MNRFFRPDKLVWLLPAALLTVAAARSAPPAAPSQPSSEPIELYQVNITKGVAYSLYTVPAGARFVLTDVVAMSQSLNPPSGSFWVDFRRVSAGAPTLAFTIPFGESFEHTYRNGIVFDEGEQVLLTTNHTQSVLDKASVYLTGELVRK